MLYSKILLPTAPQYVASVKSLGIFLKRSNLTKPCFIWFNYLIIIVNWILKVMEDNSRDNIKNKVDTENDLIDPEAQNKNNISQDQK